MATHTAKAKVALPEGFYCKFDYNNNINWRAPGFDERDVVVIVPGVLTLHIPGYGKMPSNRRGAIRNYYKVKWFPQQIKKPLPYPIDSDIDPELRKRHPENILTLNGGHVAYVKDIKSIPGPTLENIRGNLEMRLGVYDRYRKVYTLDDEIPKDAVAEDIMDLGYGHRVHARNLHKLMPDTIAQILRRYRHELGIGRPPTQPSDKVLRARELLRKSNDERRRHMAEAEVRRRHERWRNRHPWVKSNGGNLHLFMVDAVKAGIPAGDVVNAMNGNSDLAEAFRRNYSTSSRERVVAIVEHLMSGVASML